MLEVFFIALALSMDAFAVSIGLGAKHQLNRKKLAFMAAISFGLFQGLMPLIGFLAGQGILLWVESSAHWVAFALLVLIGAKMIYESFTESIEEDIAQITHKVMLILAIATSIDAMAAGFTLSLLDIKLYISCIIIGLTTYIFSFFGVFLGAKSGTWLEDKAELFGGIVLICIAFKVLLA